jgi:hypothetical protein
LTSSPYPYTLLIFLAHLLLLHFHHMAFHQRSSSIMERVLKELRQQTTSLQFHLIAT